MAKKLSISPTAPFNNEGYGGDNLVPHSNGKISRAGGFEFLQPVKVAPAVSNKDAVNLEQLNDRIEQNRSQNTTKSPSSKLLNDALDAIMQEVDPVTSKTSKLGSDGDFSVAVSGVIGTSGDSLATNDYVDNKVSQITSDYLGHIAHNDTTPLPGRSGYYVFSSSGLCSWVGGETVSENDRVYVKFESDVHTYTYQPFNSISANQVSRGSSNVDDDLTALEGDVSTKANINMSNVDDYSIPANKIYVLPIITSFTGGGNYEVGTTVTSVNLAWTRNKPVAIQKYNNTVILNDVTSWNITGAAITTNWPIVLRIEDSVGAFATATQNINFLYKRFWGVSTETSLTDTQIKALSSELSSTKTKSGITFDCTGGKYFYYAHPSSFGTATFTVGGLSYSDLVVVTRNFVNALGTTVEMKIYRSGNIQTGSNIQVNIS